MPLDLSVSLHSTGDVPHLVNHLEWQEPGVLAPQRRVVVLLTVYLHICRAF